MEYPRELAVKILTRVLSDRQALDDALNELAPGRAPDGKASDDSAGKRAWLQEVCSGTLRWRGRVDAIIDSIALKKKPSGNLRKLLMIAVYQLIAQERTSPGAVVIETVDEVKKREGEHSAKFANALLRKVADHAESWRTLPYKPGDMVEGSRWASMPEWLWAKLWHQQGEEWATRFALASLERPKIWVHHRGKPDWAAPGPVPGSYEISEGGAITAKPGFESGEFFVQDISSQILVHEISEIVKAAGGKTALDLCAAPGGKATGMAWKGLKVSATDLDGRRIELLKQTIARVAPEVELVAREAVATMPAPDLIWVDAPCTGTGILRRHPDVRWLREERELQKLIPTQQNLIKESWAKLAPGGFLAYSVCSILKEEGPGAIRQASVAGAETVREWFLTPQDAPHGDGFWAVLLRKS